MWKRVIYIWYKENGSIYGMWKMVLYMVCGKVNIYGMWKMLIYMVCGKW